MDQKMMVCTACGHEEMADMGAKCSMCGSDMKLKEEGGEMGDDAMVGGDMPAADKPMDDM